MRLETLARSCALFLIYLGAGWPAGAQQPSGFFTIAPCRVYDSRWAQGPFQGGSTRLIPVANYCGIPPDATAAALNITAVGPNAAASFSAWPAGVSPTDTNVVSFGAGVTRASNAVIKLGTSGQLGLMLSPPQANQAHAIVDVSGYFRLSATVQQWRPWEQTLVSAVDYSAGGGNPYSDVDLRVTFTNTATGGGFEQYAYWAADDLAPTIFKVETALPAGTWAWQVSACTRLGSSCLNDGWTPNGGVIFVQSNTSSGVALYDRGFPKQLESWTGSEFALQRDIVYPDGTKFDWIADTAWAAPPREFDPPGSTPSQTSAWATYIANRKAKGFKAIQVAPTVEWPLATNPPDPCDEWLRDTPLPLALGRAFRNPAGCPGASAGGFPYACSKPNAEYWNHFSNMIRVANEADLTVAVIGVMNPVGLPRANPYPTTASANAFARWLAGRLGSRFVIYSPSFDDLVPDQTSLINSVGLALKGKIRNLPSQTDPNLPPPRKDILTIHLAGGKSKCEDYHSFAAVAGANSRWLNSYLFQSGHGKNLPPSDTPSCVVGSGTAEFKAMGRARLMALTLDGYGSASTPADPKLPAVNAEGPYDPQGVDWDNGATGAGSCTSPPPSTADDREGARQAAYVSALSNAAGFGYGNWRLFWWKNPSGAFDFPSALDMKRLADNLRGLDLVAQHGWTPNGAPTTTDGWILNQTSSHDRRKVLATAGTDRLVAYLPFDEGTLVLDTASGGYSNLNCTSLGGAPAEWVRRWVDPSGAPIAQSQGTCADGSGRITLTVPPCQGVSPCDRLLTIRKNTAAPFPGEGSGPGSLETWEEPSSEDQTSSIRARFRSSPTDSESIVVSPDGRFTQSSPSTAPLGSAELVVWQADGADGSMGSVLGAIVGSDGEITSLLQLNHYTEGSQRQPAVASGRTQDALVVWASRASGTGRNGVFGRLVHASEDPLGDPRGEEVELSESALELVQNPRVGAFPGGYWVAWEVVNASGRVEALRVRRVHRDGRGLGRTLRLDAPPGEQVRLLDLLDSAPGLVRARWWRTDLSGKFLAVREQSARPTEWVPGSASEVDR